MKKEQHVLIVEDELYSYLYLKELLSKRNIYIVRVNNGEDALKFVLENNNIDLILMDIKLPNMNGIDTIKSIRSRKINIPIIVQTACAYDFDKNSAIESGCNDFITKPINCKELLFLVRKYIEI